MDGCDGCTRRTYICGFAVRDGGGDEHPGDLPGVRPAPGCRRQTPPKKPKLEPYTGVIDQILEDDLSRPRKQRHTAKRIFERLRDEHGFAGGYVIVKDYVR